jgi:hypothetical protein
LTMALSISSRNCCSVSDILESRTTLFDFLMVQ